MTSMRRVAVLGLGRMGRAMVTRLTDEGREVVTWTRSGAGVEGAVALSSAQEAVMSADAVLLALYDAAACREVLAAAGSALASGAVVVNTSTVGPDEAVHLEQVVADAGGRYVHAPVLGSVPAVLGGGLTILVGVPSLDEELGALLGSFGTVVQVGDARTAAAAKLMVNGVLAATVRTIGTALTWADELGLDRSLALDVLQRTPVGGLVAGKRTRLEERRYGEADFALGALDKDLRLLTGAAASAEGLARDLESALAAAPGLEEQDLIAFADVDPPELTEHLSLAAGVVAPPDVLAPLVAYARGHATGDPAHFDRAFWPTAHIEGVRDGRFTSWTVEEYRALFRGEPAADESVRRRRIEGLELYDSVATATMTLWHGAETFVDAFVLLKVGEEWRVANKVYQRSAG